MNTYLCSPEGNHDGDVKLLCKVLQMNPSNDKDEYDGEDMDGQKSLVESMSDYRGGLY